jgi:hypothetical protein
MTLTGLQFLKALASKRKSGCYLEIGPLFGSSTQAIGIGRIDANVPIHTIDTFEDAPWVKKRLGLNLSRKAFERFTSCIRNLHIHEGYAPDVVKDTWDAPIGFYFDDATHGNPGWLDNFDFFSPYFTKDAIICGDDFAGGWPHIVENIYSITEKAGLTLFVIGRVWAFTHEDDARIVDAINAAFPRLKGTQLCVTHAGTPRNNIAASWSWGLHKKEKMTHVRLSAPADFQLVFEVTRHNGTVQELDLAQEELDLSALEKITVLAIPDDMSVQFCVMRGPKKKTENTKDLRIGGEVTLAPEDHITAMRLSHR